MTEPLEPRISDLETRLAYVDRMVEDLSSVIATQDREIERLTGQVRRMAERMGDIDAQLDHTAAPDDKPPPHY